LIGDRETRQKNRNNRQRTHIEKIRRVLATILNKVNREAATPGKFRALNITDVGQRDASRTRSTLRER
jgi:hypothetical protein